MINKFKDFLKSKWPRKRSEDSVSRAVELPEIKSNKTSFFDRFKSVELPGLKKGEGPLISPSLSKNIERFFSRGFRETIHQVSLVTIIGLLTYTMGKIAALSIKGNPALDSAKDYTVSMPTERDFNPNELNKVKTINIFRTNSATKATKKIADTKCETSQGVSNLPIKLVNTVVLQDSVKSLASVQVRGERALKEIRVGENIDSLAKIFRIDRLELLIKNLETGACESIASEKGKENSSPISIMTPKESSAFKAQKKMKGIENVGNKFTISKTLLDEKLKDIGAILTQAKALQIQNPDGSLSFKMTEMDPEGIFPYLGLQDGDIIESINGRPVYSLNEVMALFGRIKGLDKLQLGIKREGSSNNQDYTFKK